MTESNTEIRVALVGCDVEGRQMIADRDRLARAGACVVAVVDRDQELANQAAALLGTVRSYRSIQALIDSACCEAILNFEASVQREEFTEAALRAGLHVYSDKPFAFGVDNAARLAHLAREADVVLLSAPAISLWPIPRFVRQLVQAGEIGRPIGLRAQFDADPWPWQGWDGDPAWYFGSHMGPLRDMGPYPLHLAIDLFGPATAVFCASSQLIPTRRIIDGPRRGEDLVEESADAFALGVAFARNEYALIHTTSCVHGSRASKCEVFGEFGAIAFDPFRRDREIVVRRVADYDAEPTVERVHPSDVVRRTGGTLGLDLVAGLEEFIDVIRAPRESVLGTARAVHVLEVIEQAQVLTGSESHPQAQGGGPLETATQPVR